MFLRLLNPPHGRLHLAHTCSCCAGEEQAHGQCLVTVSHNWPLPPGPAYLLSSLADLHANQ